MAEPPAISSEELLRKHFNSAFRGFDQYEVRAYLAGIAAELDRLRDRERALLDELDAARKRPAPTAATLEDSLDEAVGQETAKVLHAARNAAQEIRARAEEHVGRLVREANDEAVRIRSEAESLLAARTQEAESAAQGVLAQARDEGRSMVAEAQAVRERMLKDLARRRRLAVAQLEVMERGRTRLAEVFETVRATVEEATASVEVVAEEAQEALSLAAEAPAPLPAPVMAEPPAAREPPPAPPVAEEVPDEVAVPEPEAPPEPLPPAAEEVPVPEERRSSALRLLRRRTEDDPSASLDDEIEGIRIIRPEPTEPTEPPSREAEPVLTLVPPAEAERAPEPAPEPDADAEAVPAVEDLFARLRADRAAAVAEAEAVLARDDEVTADEAPAADGVTADDDADEPAFEAGLVAGAAVADDTPFERRDAAIDDGERALTRAIKRALADEQNEVLDALRRRKGPASIEALLPEPDEQRARYTKAAAVVLEDAAAAGGAGVDVGVVATETAEALAIEVADDVRTRLRRAVDDAGSDDELLTEAVSAAYREWKTAKAEPVARHFAAAAYAAGAFRASSGLTLRWVVDPAEGGCPDCDDNALAGPTPSGEAFPTGQLHPPAHAGCRCLAVPV
jgi:DivIVA domain-containing protein